MASPAFEIVVEGSRLRALRGLVEKPDVVLEGIGLMMVAESRKAFREEKLGGVKWKTRGDTKMNPNWPGILHDLGPRGLSKPRENRFRDKPVLADTGALKKSVAFKVVGSDTVEVGSMLPYARVLHEGGESFSEQLTEALQGKLGKWIKSTKTSALRAAKKEGDTRAKGEDTAKAGAAAAKSLSRAEGASQLAWLLNKKLRGQRIPINHPARPFIGLPPQLVADIQRTFHVTVGSA